MSNKITFDDKIGVAPKTIHYNQFWPEDANEIKSKHNLNDDRITDLEAAVVFNKGFFSTEVLLIAEYPSGVNGWYCIVGETATIWEWVDTAWVDSLAPIDVTDVTALQTQVDVIEANYVPKELGINKFDGIIYGGYVKIDGTIQAQYQYYHTDYIAVAPGDVVNTNFDAGFTPQIAVYNSSKVFISSVPSSDLTLTVPVGGAFIRCSILSTVDPLLPSDEKMVVLNIEIPNSYIPYSVIGGYLDELSGGGLYDSNLIRNDFNVNSQMVAFSTTYTSGLFEDPAQVIYQTSDYIPITDKYKNIYIGWSNIASSSYDLIRFYDNNYTLIANIIGDPSNIFANTMYLLTIPNGTSYIKFADLISGEGITGLKYAAISTLQECIEQVIASSTGKSLLWCGTSIPEGCTYPENACNALGVTCVNSALGSSFMIFDPTPTASAVYGSAGLCLTASVAELETKYRPSVTAGGINEAQLNTWKAASYENKILPYLNSVSYVVIDHGFNDRYDLDDVVAAGKAAIDWDDDSRLTFIGAFKYLTDIIWAEKPFMRIFVGGYFQNTLNDSGYNGEYICTVLSWIAEHYELPLLDAWNYTGMGKIYVPDSDNYITDFNTAHGTAYTELLPDTNGNILRFQLYCPDQVHPFTDLTGNSDIVLDSVFKKLLRDII